MCFRAHCMPLFERIASKIPVYLFPVFNLKNLDDKNNVMD